MPRKTAMKIRRFSTVEDDWLRRRRTSRVFDDPSLEALVKDIIGEVQKRGDKALFDFTKKFDDVALYERGIPVKEKDVQGAYEKVNDEEISALTYLKDRITKTERCILEKASFIQKEDGLTIHHTLTPLRSVGCYVPGGLAAYPSTLLMTAVPAKVAGVPRIAVCSPPTFKGEINPLILVAADICGVNEIYRVGGAQAVAALAYGTDSIDPVMKIVGPGRRIVNFAKAVVSRDVAVDLPAGPSELLVLADETADPRFVALDLISQSEHGPDNVVGVVTPYEGFARRVIDEVETLIDVVDRGEIVLQSLSEKGFVMVCEDLDAAIDFVNAFAPEHLEIMTRNPSKVAERIQSAGLILLGPYSPVSGSDYCFGTNHVLPTGGFSRTYSGLSSLDFVKRVNVVACTKERLKAVEPVVRALALSEGLPNHFMALKERLNV
ncbi:MAG: histidinol dehydrogenase [Candidatus Bathyarchaeota archaeon]|nr:histidinol dehydrogenase [Candidatus Bathyarchaeota archaeon]